MLAYLAMDLIEHTGLNLHGREGNPLILSYKKVILTYEPKEIKLAQLH